jgi:hypothetical protein
MTPGSGFDGKRLPCGAGLDDEDAGVDSEDVSQTSCASATAYVSQPSVKTSSS